MTQQAELRKDILGERDALAPDMVESRSAQIAQRLLELPDIISANSIFIYVNFRSEVATTGIIDRLLGHGKQVSVPLTRVREKRLDIISISDPKTELEPGYCSIPEPTPEIAAANTIEPELLDVIILPGSVFDTRGGRCGYGGGFYDRLLARIPAARRIGLAFELQIVERLALQPHDEILDLIITESRTIVGQR